MVLLRKCVVEKEVVVPKVGERLVVASVGVFPEHGYNEANDSFDLNTRVFYNSFDDAPSSFTLDISDPQKYPVGKYYVHIHDVYGEAEGLKYLWAIY